jgi:hypothetical protein
VPLFRDYVMVYFVWCLALLIPGLHHFYLGNFWRGLKYFCTYNEVVAGWILDLFELHVLVQKSVQEYGHVEGVFYCKCCNMICFIACCFGCCGSCKPKRNQEGNEEKEECDEISDSYVGEIATADVV